MSRVGNTRNLASGNKYDLLIFDFPDGYPNGGISLKFGDTPKRISGVEKVVQTFIKILMTVKSSDVIHNRTGTEFPTLTGAYNLSASGSTEIRSVAAGAVTQAETMAKSVLNIPGTDSTGQLLSATILSIDTVGDSLSISIQILTKAGESAPIAVPFTSLGIQVNE